MSTFPQRQHDGGSELVARLAKLKHAAPADLALADAIQQVLVRGAAAIGDDYFPAIVQNMANVLGAEFVFIGRLIEEGREVETIAAWVDGVLSDNIRYELTDTPCAQVLGGGSCVYPRDVAAAFPADELLVRMGVEGYVGIPLLDTDGTPIGLIVTMYRQPVPDPQFVQTLILVFAERTAAEMERVRQAQEAKRLETQLLQAQKLESLGVLAGGLAHDFNNLLSSMLGSSDLAMHQLPEGHPAREHLELVCDAGNDAGELCRQLLAYAGKGRFEVVAADLSAIVRDQEKLLRTSISKGASLQLDLSSDLPTCQVDVSQIRQILLNLVVNASECLEDGSGLIRISTGIQSFIGDPLNPQESDGDVRVFLEVSDSGSGMTPEVRAKLFDPFFTTKLTGRGLGLAAILGIVKGHKGDINVYSEPGEGSSFKIFLPANELTAPLPTPSSSEIAWQGSGRALLVDDDERVATVAAQMLEMIGFEPIVANCGQQAIELFKEHAAELVVVVLDLSMPVMNGDQVFRAMRKIDSSIPVVLTSGFNEQDTVQNFVGRGLAGFLQKPVRLADMRERLRAAIERS